MKRLIATLAAAPLALTLLGSTAHAEQAKPIRTTFDVSDLETGAPPKIAWSETTDGTETTIHGATGTDTLVDGDVADFAPMGSGYVVQTIDGARATTRWVGADGGPGRSSWRTGYGLATSPDGRAVAFTTRNGGVKVIDSEGDRVLTMPSVPAKGFAEPVHVGTGDCKEDEDSNGCTVYINSTRKRASWITSSHGIVDISGFKAVGAANGPWRGGITSFSDTGTCSVMKRGLRARWKTCDNMFSAISPDKKRVIGLPSYADGLGPTVLDVLDLRTGTVQNRFVSTRKALATYFDQVWEDPTHLLVVTYHDEQFAVVRLGLDGSMEYAVEPRLDVEGNLETPFHLQTR